jgi:hypothetical protein
LPSRGGFIVDVMQERTLWRLLISKLASRAGHARGCALASCLIRIGCWSCQLRSFRVYRTW